MGLSKWLTLGLPVSQNLRMIKRIKVAHPALSKGGKVRQQGLKP
jgi:hypothetical protein